MRDSYGLYVDKLQGEYKDTFQQIMTYVATQNNDEDSVNIQMSELLDTFLLAQEEEKPVNKIVGNDLECFCKNFCSQFGWENKLLNIADRWKTLAWWIFIVSLGDMFFMIWDFLEGKQVDWFGMNSEFNITGYLLGFVVVGLIVTVFDYITIKVMFKFEKKSIQMKVFNTIKWIGIIASFIISFQLFVSNSSNFIEVPIWILMLISGLYLCLYYVFNKERTKERKAHKISFFGVLKEDIERDTDIEFQKQMQKIYEKKRDRLLRRGKPEFSWSDFVDFQEKDVQKAYKLKPLYDWMPLTITLSLGLLWFLHSGFGMDLVIYVVILLVVETLLIKGMWKIIKSSLDVKTAWIKIERKKLEQINNIVNENEA